MELMVVGGGAVMVGLLLLSFLLLGGTIAFVVFITYRNAKKVQQSGHDPFTLQTDIAVKALDSKILSADESPEDRLAEIERLFNAGTINADERAAARTAVLGSI
jgi:hypothetical protein